MAQGNKIKNEYGECDYSFESDYVHIYNLFVYPEHRRKGNARKILKRSIAEIRETGYEGEIQIVADPKDETINVKRLIRFYESMGLKVFEYYGEVV